MEENKTKASTIAKNKYNAKAYDSLRIVVKKGQKQAIEAIARDNNESINGYVKKAIKGQIKSDTGNDIDL